MRHLFFGGPLDGQWYETRGQQVYVIHHQDPTRCFEPLVPSNRYGWFKTTLFSLLRRINKRLAPSPDVWYETSIPNPQTQIYHMRSFHVFGGRSVVSAFFHNSINIEKMSKNLIEHVMEEVSAGLPTA